MSEQDQINGGHIIQDHPTVREDHQQIEQVQVLLLCSISDIIKGEIKGVCDYIEGIFPNPK